MKRRSETGDRTTERNPTVCLLRSWHTVLILASFFFLTAATEAQSRRWSVAASAGAALLSLGSVDDDNAADAAGWARLGIPVPSFSSVKASAVYAGRVSYRYDRETAASLRVFHHAKEVTASYRGPDAELDLERGVSSTDVSFVVSYFPSWRPYFLEWCMQAGLGLTFARASANARGITYVKIAGVPTPEPLVETDALFKKTKLTVSAGIGMTVPLFSRIALTGEAMYRFAQVGAMEGEVVRFGESSTEPTTIEFNYSGFLLTAGIEVGL
jgi:hypothetical protein